MFCVGSSYTVVCTGTGLFFLRRCRFSSCGCTVCVCVCVCYFELHWCMTNCTTTVRPSKTQEIPFTFQCVRGVLHCAHTGLTFVISVHDSCMSVICSCLKVCVWFVTSNFLHTHCFVFILFTLWCATVAPVATVGSVMIAVFLSVCLFALSLSCALGSAVAPVVSHWPVPQVRVRFQVSFLWDLWSKKWHWDRFAPSASGFPCQYHWTSALYSLTCHQHYTYLLAALSYSTQTHCAFTCGASCTVTVCVS